VNRCHLGIVTVAADKRAPLATFLGSGRTIALAIGVGQCARSAPWRARE
jgi:hypothetical protein